MTPATSDLIIAPPNPTSAEWGEFERSGFEPLFFEWYKSVISVLNLISGIQPDSPAFQCADPRHYYVLAGLMHRCVRLMTSNIALSHGGKFGETAAIVDRCLSESAIRIQWLCAERSNERIIQFLTDSLRPELEFEALINENIRLRDGNAHPIETRMLNSIEKHFEAADVSRSQIQSSKRLPDHATMLKSLGRERLVYVVMQRMGSHHIHGTWPSLLSHYLAPIDQFPGYEFGPAHRSPQMHINQYVFSALVGLEAAIAYVRFFIPSEDSDRLETLCLELSEGMMVHYKRVTAEDYN